LIGCGGWGKNGVTVARRCQPCREAQIAGNEKKTGRGGKQREVDR